MIAKNPRMTRIVTPLIALTAVALFAGCSATPSASESTGDGAVATSLTGLITEGTLTVGVTLPDAPYMIPNADNVPEKGITKDLLDAVAKDLGLTITYLPVAWEGGLTGVAAGRYDVYAGSLYDTAERQLAGTFLDFMKEQTTLVTTKDNASKFTDRLDVCGLSISTIRGTTDVSYAETLTTECTDAGKDAMRVTEYPTQQDSDLAMQSGRTDVGLQSEAGAAFEIANGANKALVGKPFDGGFYVGALLNSDKQDIIDAVLGSMQTLYADGTTKTLFAPYGVVPVEPGINLSSK